MTNFQLAIAMILGIVFLLFIRLLSIRGRLSMRYTLGWALVGSSAVLMFPLLGLASFFADWLDIQASIVMLCLPILILLGISVQLSITVSGLTERLRILAEEIAFINAKINSGQGADFSGESSDEASDINND